jgi:hypothetical protein
MSGSNLSSGSTVPPLILPTAKPHLLDEIRPPLRIPSFYL